VGKSRATLRQVERIKLHGPAVLSESVDTPTMSMEEGAQLNGPCAMQNTGVFEHAANMVFHPAVARIAMESKKPPG